MKINFYYGNEVCERCGAVIKNVYIITFNDGFSIKCGSECVKKAMKETNINTAGMKYLNSQMTRIKKFEDDIERWKTKEYDKLKEINELPVKEIEDGSYRSVTEEEFEEIKNYRINEFYPYQIQKIQKEIELKLKNVKRK